MSSSCSPTPAPTRPPTSTTSARSARPATSCPARRWTTHSRGCSRRRCRSRTGPTCASSTAGWTRTSSTTCSPTCRRRCSARLRRRSGRSPRGTGCHTTRRRCWRPCRSSPRRSPGCRCRSASASSLAPATCCATRLRSFAASRPGCATGGCPSRPTSTSRGSTTCRRGSWRPPRSPTGRPCRYAWPARAGGMTCGGTPARTCRCARWSTTTSWSASTAWSTTRSGTASPARRRLTWSSASSAWLTAASPTG